MRCVIFCAVIFSRVIAPTPRRLIVGGTPSASSRYPFAVALVSCSTSNAQTYCSSFCSGSLIAPDVVITAGHCVYSEDSAYLAPEPPVPLSGMYAVVGMTSGTPQLGYLVKVASVVNRGFALSQLYRTDGDVGLAFLESCVDLVVGQTELIKLATLANELPGGSCPKAKIIGFGRSSNIPSQLFVRKTELMDADTTLHTSSVCSDAYARISVQLDGEDESILQQFSYAATRAYLYSVAVPEFQICHGGDTSPLATCSGDSGGPLVADVDSPTSRRVIGIHSFMMTKDGSDFCGLGPDYSTRVASHATWVRDQIQVSSRNCPRWTIQDSFASWPLTSLSQYSLAYRTTRCTSTQWQCASGQCISTSLVCNRQYNCFDRSDEDSAFCRVALPRHVRSAFFVPSAQDKAAADLEAQIEEYKRSGGTDGEGDGFIIVGTLDIRSSSNESTTVQTPQLRVNLKGPSLKSETCSQLVSRISAAISAEKAEGLNRAETEPQMWTDMCSQYVGSCSATDIATDAFCNDWSNYITNRELGLSIASGFDSRFSTGCALSTTTPTPTTLGSTATQVDSPVTQTTTATTATTATTTTRTTTAASTSTTTESISTGLVSYADVTESPEFSTTATTKSASLDLFTYGASFIPILALFT